MNEIVTKNSDFVFIYNKSYRLAAAVFMISNLIEQDQELKTKIKNLSLNLVSVSVNLKDVNILDTKKLILDIEKNSLELMSMLDIASVSGLISKMNGNILKEEFQSFISELNKFSDNYENNKNVSVKNLFTESQFMSAEGTSHSLNTANEPKSLVENIKTNRSGILSPNTSGGTNGHKRKDLRKSTVLEFIKGHTNVSIKDIVPHINGCSEKTIQRELMVLINEGKIKKTGERRWSKYSII
ncbi:MAG: hypothetical protein WC657_00060 [Candidatus Paceibacterota bacterium]|jgi:hypothetical protein